MFEICSDLPEKALKIPFLSTLKMAKWLNHFISGKQFQKRPNLPDLAFKSAKWQPWAIMRCAFQLNLF